jgi:hypothetical protein
MYFIQATHVSRQLRPANSFLGWPGNPFPALLLT